MDLLIKNTLLFIIIGCVSAISIVQAIETQYACFPSGGASSDIHLRCPAGERIRIREALYGENRWESCKYIVGDCTQKTSNTIDECCGRNECRVRVKGSYMSTCGAYSTFFRVVYECVQRPAQVNITCGPEADDESFQLLAVVYRNTAINLAPKTTYDESDETSASEDTTRATDFTSQHELGGLANRRSTTAAASSGDTSFFGSISHHRLSHRNAESTTDSVVVWTCVGVGLVTAILAIILGYVLWIRRRMNASSDPEKAVTDSSVEKPKLTEETGFKSPKGECNHAFVQDNGDITPVIATSHHNNVTNQQNIENERKEERPTGNNQQAADEDDNQPMAPSESSTNHNPTNQARATARAASCTTEKEKVAVDVSELPIVQQLHKTAAMVKQSKHTSITDIDENIVTRDLPCKPKVQSVSNQT